jgi:AmmeMemoRadiSam system protein A
MSRPSEKLTEISPASPGRAPEFSPEQRRVLLEIARSAIASGMAHQPLPHSPPALPNMPELHARLLEPRGVFTTLYLHGELRGCVGYALPIRSLFQAVAETARAAAFQDTRFWPVTPDESPDLKISLSVLSTLVPIEAEQVEVGRHGLMISDGLRRGLLLPQVPVEHGWDRQTFLEQTCRKAGAPNDAWKSALIEAFTAEVFGDEDVPA